MRKNSRGKLSGAVRDETLAGVQRQEEGGLLTRQIGDFARHRCCPDAKAENRTALLKKPHNIIPIGPEVLTSTSSPRLWEVRTRLLSGALLANSRRQVPVLTMAKGSISCSR